VLFLGIVIVAGLMYGLFKLLDAYATSKEIAPSPMARSERERLPPPGVPRLQGAPDHKSLDDDYLLFEKKEPTLEWDALRQKFEDDLNYYQEADPGTGMARVPIDFAKKKLLEKGLPVRQQPPQGAGGEAREGLNLPTAASAGRQTEKRDK
jgi:hypothetical protein